MHLKVNLNRGRVIISQPTCKNKEQQIQVPYQANNQARHCYRSRRRWRVGRGRGTQPWRPGNTGEAAPSRDMDYSRYFFLSQRPSHSLLPFLIHRIMILASGLSVLPLFQFFPAKSIIIDFIQVTLLYIHICLFVQEWLEASLNNASEARTSQGRSTLQRNNKVKL